MASASSKGLVLITGGASPLPDPPYPHDVAARGWRFELDGERIFSSSTWKRTPSEIRPWLLLLWLISWHNRPCGTLENEDDVIAGGIGMPLNLFRAHRENLMRGWQLHADGRLYHATVTECVLRMEEWRSAEKTRKAGWRAAKQAQEKQPLSENVPESVPRDSHVTDATGTGTGTGSKKEKTKHIVASRLPACPVQKIVTTYNAVCVSCTRSEVPTDTLNGHITARWRQLFTDGAATDYESAGKFFSDFFARVQASRFLTGQTKARDGGKPFRASLRWLMKPENFAKTIEGEYDNR